MASSSLVCNDAIFADRVLNVFFAKSGLLFSHFLRHRAKEGLSFIRITITRQIYKHKKEGNNF